MIAVSRRIRTSLVGVCSLASLGLIAATFWYQDVQYSLPTPRPAGLTQVAVGTVLTGLDHWLPAAPGDQRPILLHFYSPECPCSRFNIDHLRELTSHYGKKVRFIAVVQSDDADSVDRFRKNGLAMEVVWDPLSRLATETGTYSTPQAAILDSHGKLYYRGNYNASRYCVDRATEFARLALESLTAGKPAPTFPPAATVAYGCPSRRGAKAQQNLPNISFLLPK